MESLEGRGEFTRGDVSFGPCNYGLDPSARETAGRGTVTLLNPPFLPNFPQTLKGYTLTLESGARLTCQLHKDLTSEQSEQGGASRAYLVKCWPE